MTTGPDDPQPNIPPSSSQGRFTRLLNRVPPAVSFASLLLGVILASASVYNIPDQIAKSQMEVRQASLALYESEVKFEVFYIDVTELAFQQYRIEQKNGANHVFWQYPMLQNDVFHSIPQDSEEIQFPAAILPDEMRKHFRSSVWKPLSSQVVLLVVRQIGKRMARDVRIEAEHVTLGQKRAVEVFATSDIKEGWIEDTMRRAGEVQRESIKLGDLDTGQGLLIPLLVTYSFTIKGDEFCCRVAMNSIYIPLRITFTDDFDKQPKEFDVRPMLGTGIEFSAGVTGRG